MGAKPYVIALVLGAMSVTLTGCGSSLPSLPSLPKMKNLNPFAEENPPMPGKRISVMPQKQKVPGELADAAAPITLPAPVANADWTQPGGEADNAPGHLSLAAAVRQTWTADAGSGSSKKGRVTASPVVYGGRVYTLDSNGLVSAFPLAGGGTVWKANLKPTLEKKENPGFSLDLSWSGVTGGEEGGGYGGGLAVDEGRIYGASGHGAVVALDPATGKRLWERYLGSSRSVRHRRRPAAKCSWLRLMGVFIVCRGWMEQSFGRCAACRKPQVSFSTYHPQLRATSSWCHIPQEISLH